MFESIEPVGVLEPDPEHGVTGERQPVAATTFTHLDPFIVLERAIAACGIYPAIDPLVSSSRILDLGVVGEEHYAIARRVQPILQKYQSTKKAPTL